MVRGHPSGAKVKLKRPYSVRDDDESLIRSGTQARTEKNARRRGTVIREGKSSLVPHKCPAFGEPTVPGDGYAGPATMSDLWATKIAGREWKAEAFTQEDKVRRPIPWVSASKHPAGPPITKPKAPLLGCPSMTRQR